MCMYRKSALETDKGEKASKKRRRRRQRRRVPICGWSGKKELVCYVKMNIYRKYMDILLGGCNVI